MKGSAVAQSWKALAAKINNQAPLGPRESNRLLTALTSSFRKHLDEAHPSISHDEGRRSHAKGDSESSHQHGVQSSRALADYHMASVLTNPLLVKSARSESLSKPEFNAGTAAVELKNGANPFDLLESYHAKSYGTIEVAVACMKHFRRSIKDLTYEEQVAKVLEEEAGKRVLSWLWNSNIMQSQAYVDNLQVQDGLVWLVMMEGHEDFLWQWLESDLVLPQPSASKVSQKVQSGYFWKSRIIYAMVMTKLGSPHRGARSADAALKLYFRAVQPLQQRKEAVAREKMISTGRARLALEKALTHGSDYHYSETSPALYDEFIDIYKNHKLSPSYNAQKHAFDEFHRAQLDLWHPTRPSASVWYELSTREVPAGDGTMSVRELLQSPKTNSDTLHYIKQFSRAARLMKIAGKHAECDRLVAIAQTYYPNNASQVTQAFQGLSANARPDESHGTKSEKEQLEHQHQHNWLSNYFPAPT
jgi:hypothetical protein